MLDAFRNAKYDYLLSISGRLRGRTLASKVFMIRMRVLNGRDQTCVIASLYFLIADSLCFLKRSSWLLSRRDLISLWCECKNSLPIWSIGRALFDMNWSYMRRCCRFLMFLSIIFWWYLCASKWMRKEASLRGVFLTIWDWCSVNCQSCLRDFFGWNN